MKCFYCESDLITSEREVLKVLDGDCDTAIGVSSNIEDKKIYLEAELFSIDGKERYYIKSEKELKLANELGREVGQILKERSLRTFYVEPIYTICITMDLSQAKSIIQQPITFFCF